MLVTADREGGERYDQRRTWRIRLERIASFGDHTLTVATTEAA